MRTPLLICWLVWAACAQAQFYMTDVCLHDAAQRLFVVEAARVHAWIENQSLREAERIASVSWSAEGKLNGDTQWEVIWRDAAGADVRRARIAYDGAALQRGADFYRPIWRQLRGLAGKPALSGDAQRAEAAMSAFWQGANETGVSRMSGMITALDFAREQNPSTNAADAGRLAGMLIHSAMPILADSCTLDYVLLARGTAWLCHAEETATARLRDAWPPLMYLAGREKPAADRWRQFFKPDHADTLAARWWELILRSRPTPLREVALFAAEPQNRGWGLPFFLAYQRMDGGRQSEILGVIELLYGAELQEWPDLGAPIMRQFGVGGPQSRYPALPALARLRWLQTLGHVAAEETGGRHPELAAEAVAAMNAMAADKNQDMACRGLSKAAPLINRGFDLRRDALEPVAALTEEDLLVFGWDLTLETMQAWFHFLNGQLAVRDEAARLRDECLQEMPSLKYWLDRVHRKDPPACDIPPDRVEFFEADVLARPGIYLPEAAKGERYPTSTPERPPLRNPFKRSFVSLTQHFVLINVRPKGVDFLRHLDLQISQGGEALCAKAYAYLTRPSFRIPASRQAEYDKRLDRLLAACPNATLLQRQPSTPPSDSDRLLEATQTLERLFWEAPGSGSASIFDRYAKANAMQSAKRFYQQILPFVSSVGFSNTMPQRRWVLAWWEKDDAAMASAAEDSATYSEADLGKRVLHLLAIGDDKGAERMLRALLERYPPNPEKPPPLKIKLQAFLPLLPALADASSPRHEEALDYFHPLGASYTVLRCVLARRFQLPVDKAARFLGEAEKMHVLTRAVTAHLRGDTPAFQAAYNEIHKDNAKGYSGENLTLLECMRHDLMKTPIPENQPDLKPEKIERLDEQVIAKLKATGQ